MHRIALLILAMALAAPGGLGATSLSTKDFLRFSGVDALDQPAAHGARFTHGSGLSWADAALISVLGMVAIAGIWTAVRTTRRTLKRRRQSWRRRGRYRIRW